MPTTVSCPDCRRHLNVPRELVGKLVRCPDCHASFQAILEPDYLDPNQRYSTGPSQGRLTPMGAGPSNDPEVGSAGYEERSEPRRRRRAQFSPHRGSTILILGILSLGCAPLILGPIAWKMGSADLRKMREGEMDPSGEGQTRTGQVCGMIATILALILTLLYCVVFSLAAMGGGANGPPPGPHFRRR